MGMSKFASQQSELAFFVRGFGRALFICEREGLSMPDYQKMYLLLFNAITDALKEMENLNYGEAAELLRKAQSDSEDIYISG